MSLQASAQPLRPANPPMTVIAKPADRAVAIGGSVTVINQAPVFERLHALVRKNYIADLGADDGSGTLVLRHLGRAPDIVLHANGVIEPLDVRQPRHKRGLDALERIGADGDADHLRFMRFLDTVPPPSLRDRTRPWRRKYVYFPAVLMVTWGICIGFTAAVFGG